MFLRTGEQLIQRCGWIFAPLSIFYAFAVFLRNKAYDWGLLSVTRVKPVVVSVGNVVAGGSGKTPFVEALARQFAHRKVAILSRGYGEVADEAMWLKKKLAGVDVFVGKDRAELAKQVDADLILLDDGMQHRKLHRDFEIVLGERKGRYLPWGFLRDDPKRRADAEFQVKLRVKRLVDMKGREAVVGKQVGIFCGIAKPGRFKKSVEGMGFEVVKKIYFGDHERADLSRLDPGLQWICTEKDAIKIREGRSNIFVLEMEMETPNWEKLIEKIDAEINNRRL